MTYLTAPDAVEAKHWYRYYVGLASEQLNYQGVPEFTRTIDLLVTQLTLEAIEQLLAACSWLKGYEVASYNEPSLNEVLF